MMARSLRPHHPAADDGGRRARWARRRLAPYWLNDDALPAYDFWQISGATPMIATSAASCACSPICRLTEIRAACEALDGSEINAGQGWRRRTK